jgi:hypothetical protein
MQIDLHFKAQNLLESLANSIHDRDPQSSNPFWFNTAEVQLTEKWLHEFVLDLMTARDIRI